jgi:DnaK suppressor protein
VQPAETNQYASLLRAKQMELSDSLRYRDEIVIEKAPDALDEVQFMRERELAVQTLNRNSNLHRQICEALSRLSRGTYGLCLHCGEDIPPKRMAAVPWAGYCIQCQEQIDLGEIEPADAVAALASAA